MTRYIILFVLVMMMVKTNAQTTVTYRGFNLDESDSLLLVRIKDSFAQIGYLDTLRAKISSDANFTPRGTDGTGGYFILVKEPGSSISKSTAINYYSILPYVAYASFMFEDSGRKPWGYAEDIFVKKLTGVSTVEMEDTLLAHGMIAYEPYPYDASTYKVYLSKSQNTLRTTEVLSASGIFQYVHPNCLHLRGADQAYGLHKQSAPGQCTVVNTATQDEFRGKQWGLYNDGTLSTHHTLGADIEVCNAWDFSNGSGAGAYSGSGIKVAVVDDGVDTQNPDLGINSSTISTYFPVTTQDNILRNSDGSVNGHDATTTYNGTPTLYGNVTPSQTGQPDMYSSHGTNCAGIIAALRNNMVFSNYYRIAGVAYNAKIMPIRSLWSLYPIKKYQGLFNDQTVAEGIDWAWSNGADIISCSWSYPYPYSTAYITEDAINRATSLGRGGKGSVVVFSTGNENTHWINWPASEPNVVSVGALTMCNTRKQAGPITGPLDPGTYPGTTSCDGVTLWGSNYGNGFDYTPIYPNLHINSTGKLTVLAPGVDIYTTETYYPFGHYGLYRTDFGGTSAAAPHVAGMIALMLETNPCLTSAEVKELVKLSATPISGYSAVGYDVGKDWNNEVGYGRANASDAVALSYDIYKQAKTETTDKVYATPHVIYAGNAVTNIYKNDWYRIISGINITFHAPKVIILDPGFEAQNGSIFTAELSPFGGCNISEGHSKSSPDDRKRKVFGEQSGTTSDAFTSIINIYPNPVKDRINVDFTIPQEEEVSFAISNVVGQNMAPLQLRKFGSGRHIQALETGTLIPGVYLLTVKTMTGNQQFKFVKN